MTADVELLPLPEKVEVDKHLPTGVRIYAYDADTLRTHARACVAHATAAKDAELVELRSTIEALRAEVEAVWAAMPRDARYLDPPDGGCVPLHEQVRRMAADATRAERLAEALRRCTKWGGLGKGWDSGVALDLIAWIEAGMVGELPPLPHYLAALGQENDDA